jgi:hypothetical protein
MQVPLIVFHPKLAPAVMTEASIFTMDCVALVASALDSVLAFPWISRTMQLSFDYTGDVQIPVEQWDFPWVGVTCGMHQQCTPTC